MRSKLHPMKKVARSLRRHRELILNGFRAEGKISAGIVEGFNNKAQLAIRKSYGFREYETIEWALFHQLGALPEPKFTHEFCQGGFFRSASSQSRITILLPPAGHRRHPRGATGFALQSDMSLDLGW
jgi:hypothetical protein